MIWWLDEAVPRKSPPTRSVRRTAMARWLKSFATALRKETSVNRGTGLIPGEHKKDNYFRNTKTENWILFNPDCESKLLYCTGIYDLRALLLFRKFLLIYEDFFLLQGEDYSNVIKVHKVSNLFALCIKTYCMSGKSRWTSPFKIPFLYWMFLFGLAALVQLLYAHCPALLSPPLPLPPPALGGGQSQLHPLWKPTSFTELFDPFEDLSALFGPRW